MASERSSRNISAGSVALVRAVWRGRARREIRREKDAPIAQASSECSLMISECSLMRSECLMIIPECH